MNVCLYWHRNDLRLARNEALLEASNSAHLQPIVFRATADLSAAAARFRDQAILDLAQSYETRGSRLLVLTGDPLAVIPKIANDAGITHLVYSRSHDAIAQAEEARCVGELSALGVVCTGFWTDVLVARQGFPPDHFEGDPDFATFQKQYTSLIHFETRPATLPSTLPSPPEALLDWPNERATLDAEPTTVSLMMGGETAGHARVKTYFWEADTLSQYAQRREALGDVNATSRLSPYLAQGSISPRHVYSELERFEKKRIANKSTRWLRTELLWRDYLRWLAHLASEKLFAPTGMNGDSRAWDTNEERLKKWTTGLTGWPLIDAMMRELSSTGFLSHQGRVNVSSFLVNDLGIDWRKGARHFAQTLIDHDTCSNYTNWQMVAGLSPVALKHRRGIKQQSLRLDRSARYIKKWVPELKRLPPPTIHEMNGRDCRFDTKAFGVALGETYPAPMGRAKT